MGAEPVVVLYASISVLNLMRAATGSQCKDTKRGVTWALLGSLKLHSESFVEVRLCLMEVQLEEHCSSPA